MSTESKEIIAISAISLPTAVVVEADSHKAKSLSISIGGPADYEAAGTFYTDLREFRSTVDKQRLALTEECREAVEKVNAYFKAPIAMIDHAMAQVKRTMVAYDQKQREIAEAKRKAEEEERRRQEAEAKRIREEAEAKVRAAAEKQRQAEEEARKANLDAEAERTAKIEARKAQMRAEEEARVAKERADDLEAKARATPMPVVADLPKTGGVSRKKVWKWKLKDNIGGENLKTLPHWMICLNEDAVDARVKALKEHAAEMMGEWLEIWSEDDLAIGRGRK